MTATDLYSDSEFKKLDGKGYAVLSKKCNNKQKPGLDICCPGCGKYFRFKWQLNEHSRIHDNKIHLKCHLCSSTFIRVGDLNKHLIVHSTEKPFKCQFCSKYFKSKQTRLYHEDTHNQNTYVCRICGETFKRYYLKIKHERTHRQEEIITGENGDLKYKCIFCNGIFASHEFLEEHVRKSHKRKSLSVSRKLKPKIYKCSVCLEKFSTYKEHRTHILSSHPSEFKNIFFETCKICQKKVSSSFLSYHMKAHKGVKPHNCRQCDAKFARRGELNKHMLVHNKSKIYQCTWCDDILKSKQDLESHKLQHFGKKRYKCDECESAYHTTSNLQQHKRRWHIRNFEICTICQKEVLKMDLNRHMKINHEKNEKLCDHCGVTFLNEFKLKKHLSHLQNASKAENLERISHPYYRYEGSNELPFKINSSQKLKNYINKTKSNRYDSINDSGGFNSKINKSLLMVSLFIGECSVCGFTSYSRQRLKSHLQYQKFKLGLWGIEAQKEPTDINKSESLIIGKNGIESTNYFSANSFPVVKEVIHNIKGNIINIQPTKEISWINSLSFNLLTNDTNNFNSINFEKYNYKSFECPGYFQQPLQISLKPIHPSLNNGISARCTDVNYYNCQKCFTSNSIPNTSNLKNNTVIFKCTFCESFNKYKNKLTKIPNVPIFNNKVLYSTRIVNSNKSLAADSVSGLYLMGPLVSLNVPDASLPVHNAKALSFSSPLIGQPTSPREMTPNYKSTSQNLSLSQKICNIPIVKEKRLEQSTNQKITTTNNLVKDSSKILLPSSISSTRVVPEKVYNAEKQEISIKKELAAIKGKQTLSVEELEKLRGCDVNTLLNYLLPKQK